MTGVIEPDGWQLADALLEAALDLPTAERAAFVEARAPDPAVRAQVARLLAAAENADELLPAGGALGATLAAALVEGSPGEDGAGPASGSMIDAFQLTRKLGEGGMGEVWEAEQHAPVRRRVALKLIRPGMGTRQVVSRFECERQALALMNHSNVAQVFGGGATEAGRPYFVMEYVPGVPVTTHCDQQRLPVDERLQLFLQVCEGVQHAHQKGIVHRDLKPSNILVSGEGRGVPKIIDFGVSRAVGQPRAEEAATLTQMGQVVGTPEYMSPEQADPGGADVDTRADVYALGVLLYELLAGVRPFEAAESPAGYLDLLRRIRETDPVRPSQQVEAALRRRLRGDLDWIVLKALEKDRRRRYDSARGLADDVRRHLAHEPVLAGPPSTAYRLGKLLRRHRTFVSAAAVALLALVAGTVAATTQAVRALRAEQAAREEARTAREVSDFLAELFEVQDPGLARGNTVTARELLDRGADRIRGRLADQPLVRARLQTTIGEIYRRLGLYDAARPLLEEALSTRERLVGANDAETVRTLYSLARLRFDGGDHADAEASYRTALARLSAGPAPDPVERARLRFELAAVLTKSGRYPESESLARQALDALAGALGPSHPELARPWDILGSVLLHQGRLSESERAYRRALALHEASPRRNRSQIAVTWMNLSLVLQRQGREAEGEDHLRRAAAVFEELYGPSHRLRATALHNLASLYLQQGRFPEAKATFQRSLAVREGIYGEDHPRTFPDLNGLGHIALLQADYQGARHILERTLDVEEKTVGSSHPQVAHTATLLGDLYLRLADLRGAEAAYGRALAAAEKTYGPGHTEVAGILRGLGEVALRRGRLSEADALVGRALAAAEKDGPSSRETPNVLDLLGELRTRQGRLGEARDVLERSRSLRERQTRPGHFARSETLVRLAELMAAQGRLAEAETLFREALAVAEGAHGPGHPGVARALRGLRAVTFRRPGRPRA
jgi:eukaryotic-like serine/threonine-protein kinase